MRNHSQVLANYTIEKINDDEKDLSFSLNEKSGSILPGSSNVITVTYTPSMPGAYTCTQYNIGVLGGNIIKFTCIG